MVSRILNKSETGRQMENVMLNISANWVELSFVSSFNILIGILLGPTDLFEFRENIIFCISSLLVGLKKAVLIFIFYEIRKIFV